MFGDRKSYTGHGPCLYLRPSTNLRKISGVISFLTSWLIMTIAAAVMVAVTPGMTPVGEPPILGIAAFALFMALINASIKPIVHLIALPFAILSLGLVTLIINWLFMRLASWLAVSLFGVGVFVHGFWWSVLGSLVLTIVAGIVGSILDQ